MKRSFFDAAMERVRRARKHPGFSYLQRWLPSLPGSQHNPGWPKIASGELFEQMLLRMDEDEWKAYNAPLLSTDGPRETGDQLVDEWERLLEAGEIDPEDFQP